MWSMQDKLRAWLRDVRISAAIISLFLSAWSVYLDDVVNSDGVLYLRTAELLAHSGGRPLSRSTSGRFMLS